MKQQIISNLFKPSVDEKTIGKIDSIISPGWYLVVDSSGRRLKVESDVQFVPGTTVVVQFGKIVRRAAAQKNQKVYEV